MNKLFWVSILLFFLFSCTTNKESFGLAVEYFNIGNAYLELQKFDKAETYFLKAVDINPEYNSPRFNLSDIYIAQSKFELAKTQLDILFKEDSKNTRVNNMLGYYYYSMGALEESLKFYLYSYNLGDISKNTMLNIVKLYYQLDMLDSAKEFMDKLLIGKESADLLYIAGVIYDESKNTDRALSLYLAAVDKGLDSIDLYKRILSIYISNKDYTGQKDILEVLIDKSKPENKSKFIFKLGYIYMVYDNNFSRGYKLLESAVDSGFSDKLDVESLLNEPNLIEKDKIRQLFVDNKIIE